MMYKILIALKKESKVLNIFNLINEIDQCYSNYDIKIHFSINTIEINYLKYDLDSSLLYYLLSLGDVLIKTEEE